MNLIIRIIISTIAVMVTALLLPGAEITDVGTGIIVAIVLGLLNAILRPILIFLTLPVTLLTLGLFILVINAGMVMLADRLVDGFSVKGFWWALVFSIVQWIVQGFLSSLRDDRSRKEIAD